MESKKNKQFRQMMQGIFFFICQNISESKCGGFKDVASYIKGLFERGPSGHLVVTV